MAQKSILSFFKRPEKSNIEISKSNSDDESPQKKPLKRVKHIIDSDDEEDSENVQDTKNSTEETNKNENGELKNQKETSTLTNEDLNGSASPEFIPKRKTARKQIRSKRSVIKNSPESSVKNTEVKDEEKKNSETDDISVINKSSDKSNESLSSSPVKSKKRKQKSEEEIDSGKPLKKPHKDEKKIESNKPSKNEDLNTDSDESSGGVKSSPEKEKTKICDAEQSEKCLKPIHKFFATKKQEPTKEKSEKEGSDKKSNKSLSSGSADTSYNPSKNHYHPISDAIWKKGERVPYLALAKTLECIENISSRLKIIELLANLFRSVIVLTPEDLLQTLYLCLNRLAPEYEGIELGIGETLLMKAVAQATGRTLEKIKAEVAVKGDLGLVAESSRGNQRVMFAPPKLTVISVFNKFKDIANMSGHSVMSKKTDKIQTLFVACRDCEAKFIIRSLSGKLRIGLAEQSVLAALARAVTLTPPAQSYPPEIIDTSSSVGAEVFKKKLDVKILELKSVYCECPNYDIIIPLLLKEGISGLAAKCHLTPGIPLKPMLAHPTKGVDEVLKRFDKNTFTCEFKYDGERAQIHMTEDGDVKIYSRNQENNTSKYPDIIARLPKALKEETKSFILDTEAVAWDREEKQILPFQVLSTRKKKDAIESEITVQICIMAFDILYLNGKSLVKCPLKERRELLWSSFNEVESEFLFAKSKDGDNADVMQHFLDESIKGNCEGLMVKSLEVDASYEIAKRSHNWLKLKKDYLEGIGDTIDLVVIGGYHGKGKRVGTYGGFLLACYDDQNEEFQSICKIGTGFKEDELEEHSKFLKQHIINSPKSYFQYDGSLEPDEWFEPVQVWEVKCADLSISPVHRAAIGIVDPEKGISLRFPRFLKVRKDKKVEDATPSSLIATMYEKQEQVQNQKNKDFKTEEDYY